MAELLSILSFVAATLMLCYQANSKSASFTVKNPIKVASDAFIDFESFEFRDDGAISFTPISLSSTIEAIYQFGDSISDTGNFIRENPSCNFAKLPYGQNFFHKPTGRCSNGLLMIDYFTQFLNLPFLDPYLKKDGNFSHGVNFAVAGATALNVSTLAMKDIGYCPTNSSLLVQLDWFRAHLSSICSNTSECKQKMAKALIMVGEIGGNDYNYAFFQGKPLAEIYNMVPGVVQVIKKAIKEVINLGATRVIVPGNFPIGCMTVYLQMFKTNYSRMYDELHCLKRFNNFAKFHNYKIQEAIGEVQREYPNLAIVYADYFSTLEEILWHATSLGFDKNIMQTPCCGIRDDHQVNLDSHITCGSKGFDVCEDPYKHVNWDGIHLTQHAYHIMAKLLIERINILGSISYTV